MQMTSKGTSFDNVNPEIKLMSTGLSAGEASSNAWRGLASVTCMNWRAKEIPDTFSYLIQME